MLEHLFGSRTRVRLLRLFLGTPGEAFFVREIGRRVKAQIHAVRRELENLEQLGIIVGSTPPGDPNDLRARQRRYYRLDEGFFLMPELRSLVLKSQFLLEAEFKRRVAKMGTLKYFALLGIFMGEQGAPVDAFLVGSVNRTSLARLMKQFERELGGPVNYSIMTVREYEYRRGVGDRFLYDLLEAKQKIIVLDDLTPAGKEQTRALAH